MQFVAFGVRDTITLEKAVSLLTRIMLDLVAGYKLQGEKKVRCLFFLRLGTADKKSVLVHAFQYSVDRYIRPCSLEDARYSPYLQRTQREFSIPKGVRATEFVEIAAERAYQIALLQWGATTEKLVIQVPTPDVSNYYSKFIIEFRKNLN